MDCLDIRGYPQPRFASEYGLQSLPRFQTLSSVTVKDDWSYFSPIMMHRQHHGSGEHIRYYYIDALMSILVLAPQDNFLPGFEFLLLHVI